jgi:hypothetical protein
MAQQVTTTLIDDIDGGKAAETIRFAIDGVEYEIDLSARNAGRLRKALDEFVANGRRVGGRQVARRKQTRRSPGHKPQDIRDWAKANGHAVADRGAIPATLREAFYAAQG